LGELFLVKKNGRDAMCQLRSHQFGWELWLFVGQQLEVVQTQVCRSQDEVLMTGDQWKAAIGGERLALETRWNTNLVAEQL
jgi:hypothetical protein